MYLTTRIFSIESKMTERRPLQWTHIPTLGKIPSARSGHSFTLVGRNGFLFGGCDTSDPPGPIADMYQLKLSSPLGPYEWITVHSKTPPAARWRHSMNLIQQSKMILFGGFHSSTLRFNDVWLFNPVTMKWTNHTDKNALQPCPRGGHSACYSSLQLYIFGGYGGTAYSRQDFDDLFVLHTETMTWSSPRTRGRRPGKRSGHVANIIHSQMYVYGGWNNSVQYNDLHVLDLDTMSWSTVDGPHCATFQPRWGIASCTAAALPHVKLIVFGGIQGQSDYYEAQGTFMNDVHVFDSGTHRWSTPEVIGEIPEPRSYTTINYDTLRSRIILFGGWSNAWHNDIYSLDIGPIVGPPYSITSIYPLRGSIIGGTQITIDGADFLSKPVTVRFASKWGIIDVVGKHINAACVMVTAPDFSASRPGPVEVRLAFDGDSFTATCQTFDYVAVTYASSTFAYGPGVLSGGAAGETTVFVIQARDSDNELRSTGGDAYRVRIFNVDDQDPMHVMANIQCADNGSYYVTYRPPRPTTFEISIEYMGDSGERMEHIYASPLKVTFVDTVGQKFNTLVGPLVMQEIGQHLVDIEEMIDECEMKLSQNLTEHETWSDEDVRTVVISVKTCVTTIATGGAGTLFKMDKCQVILKTLSDLQHPKVAISKQLRAYRQRWDAMVLKLPLMHVKLAPLLKEQQSKTRRELVEYDESLQSYKTQTRNQTFWKYESGYKYALRSITNAFKTHAEKMETYAHFKNLADLFESAELLSAPTALLDEVLLSMVQMQELWERIEDVSRRVALFHQLPWSQVDGEMMAEEAEKMMSMVENTAPEVQTSSVYTEFAKKCQDFSATCPLVKSLRHPSMRLRHWTKFQTVIEKTFDIPDDEHDIQLGIFLQLNLHCFPKQVQAVAEEAQRDLKHENLLADLKSRWGRIAFHTEVLEDVTLLSLIEEDSDQLVSDEAVVESILSSQSYFRKDFMTWNASLSLVAHNMEALLQVQSMWTYLKPLFLLNVEVQNDLPSECEQFKAVHAKILKAWSLMVSTQLLLLALSNTSLSSLLESCSSTMQTCKIGLKRFLHVKRQRFPRFYFLSEMDLLDVLSNASKPNDITKHMPKLFPGIHSMVLDTEDTNEVTALYSILGDETLQLVDSISMSESSAEEYLTAIEDTVKMSVKMQMKASLMRYPTQPRVTWATHKEAYGDSFFPDTGQITLLVSRIEFVKTVEKAMQKVRKGQADAMLVFAKVAQLQLCDLIKCLRSEEHELSLHDKVVIGNLICMDCRDRDLLQTFCNEFVIDPEMFSWKSQMRPYVQGKGKVVVLINTYEFLYGYNFHASCPRMIMTPWSDRISVTISHAITSFQCSSLIGDSTTGKSGVAKDLSLTVAQCYYEYPCTVHTGYQQVGHFLKGIATLGAWGCLDNAHVLQSAVLATIATQLCSLFDGLRADADTIVIDGETVTITPTCAIFMTLQWNPSSTILKHLPEHLTNNMRPIAIVLPETLILCRSFLASVGVTEFFVLGNFLNECYHHCKIDSSLKKYDWGLRNLKRVITQLSHSIPSPFNDDLCSLRSALFYVNESKMSLEDKTIFERIVHLYFPLDTISSASSEHSSEDTVEKEIVLCAEEACEALGLWPDPSFCISVGDLSQVLTQQKSAFVIGPPGVGKSTLYTVLALAHEFQEENEEEQRKAIEKQSSTDSEDEDDEKEEDDKDDKDNDDKDDNDDEKEEEVNIGLFEKQKVEKVILEPKAQSIGYFYGYLDETTCEWQDGLLPHLLRRIEHENVWLILDGQIDGSWMDIMHSLMEEGSYLWLPSHERIAAKKGMRILFESISLETASPSIVSRGGILSLRVNEDGSQWKCSVGAWVTSRDKDSEKLRNSITTLLFAYITPTLSYVNEHKTLIYPTEGLTCVRILLNYLDAMIDEYILADALFLETVIAYATMWAFGGPLVGDERVMFNEWWRSSFTNVVFPTGSIFDFWLNTQSMAMEEWYAALPQDYEETTSSLLVPIPEHIQIAFLGNLLLREQRSVLIMGPGGCGKSAALKSLLRIQDRDTTLTKSMTGNVFLKSGNLQSLLEVPLRKSDSSSEYVFEPRDGYTKLLYSIEDVHLLHVDEYGARSAVALMRLHLDHGFWYDYTKMCPKLITEAQYVCVSNSPTQQHRSVSTRFMRHFAAFSLAMPAPTSLTVLFGTILHGHMKEFDSFVLSALENIIEGSIVLQDKISTQFRPAPQHVHYEFNLRHLTRIFRGLMEAESSLYETSSKIVQLWMHECFRVYSDMLISSEHISQFNALFQPLTRKLFPSMNLTQFFVPSDPPLVFCHYNPQLEGDVLVRGPYDLMDSHATLLQKVQHMLKLYNTSFGEMDLVLLHAMVHHVIRLSRVINTTGHILLIGPGGSGRQSLTRLAAYLTKSTMFTIRKTLNVPYTSLDFKSDLAQAFEVAGCGEKKVVFMATVEDLPDDKSWVYLQEWCSTDYISNLFSSDERATIVETIGRNMTTLNDAQCWIFFQNQVTKNLHFVLCGSSDMKGLRERSTIAPSLLSTMTIQWVFPWTIAMFQDVAEMELGEMDILPLVLDGVLLFMTHVYQLVNRFVQQNHGRRLCPSTYLSYLRCFQGMYNNQVEESSELMEKYENAVSKLEESGKAVMHIRRELDERLNEAHDKQVIANELKIKVDVEIENEKQAKEKEEAALVVVQKSQGVVTQRQAAVDKELAKTKVTLEAANTAVETIPKKELGQVKSIPKLQAGLGDVFAALIVLFATIHPHIHVQVDGRVKDADRSWVWAKATLLSNVNGLLDDLLEFPTLIDQDKVPEINLAEVRPYLFLDHFTVEGLQKKNNAVAGLCSWLHHIIEFYDAMRPVFPKREALAVAEKRLRLAEKKYVAAQEATEMARQKLSQLEKEHTMLLHDVDTALNIVQVNKVRLELANRVQACLGPRDIENWSAHISRLAEKKRYILGDILLASSFVSLLGPLDAAERDEMVQQLWIPYLTALVIGEGDDIPISEIFSLEDALFSSELVRDWKFCDLSDDPVSIQNALITWHAPTWPMLLDPHYQGIHWLSQVTSDNGTRMHVRKQKDNTDFWPQLEQSLKFGYMFCISEMETVESALEPLLSKSFITKEDGSLYIHLIEKDMLVHPSFRLFLQCTSTKPYFPSRFYSHVTIVNFAVSLPGLEEQILNKLWSNECATIGAAYNHCKFDLLVSEKAYCDSGRGIVERMSSTAADITQDEELIDYIEVAVENVREHLTTFEILKTKQEAVQNIVTRFKPVAMYGANLFMMMTELTNLNEYYRYSLNLFTTLFFRAIKIFHQKREMQNGGFQKNTEIVCSQMEPFAWDTDIYLTLRQYNVEGSNGEVTEDNDWFKLFQEATVFEEPEDEDPFQEETMQRRSIEMVAAINEYMYSVVQRGMFHTDKIIFMTLLFLLDKPDYPTDEMSMLLQPEPAAPLEGFPTSGIPPGVRQWLSPRAWFMLQHINTSIPCMATILENVTRNPEKWQVWIEMPEPETEQVPWEVPPSRNLHKLILLKAMRPDRMMYALGSFLQSEMGKYNNDVLDERNLIQDISVSTPVCFVFQNGNSVSEIVESMGELQGFCIEDDNLIVVNIGAQSERRAEEMLKEAAKNGSWILLDNVHFIPHWFPDFEDTLAEISLYAHSTFRCFFSIAKYSIPPAFTVLQNCVKVMIESPEGLKGNLLRSWSSFSAESISACKKPNDYQGCLFGLCYFHALLVGRTRFGNDGWTLPYRFTPTDLAVSAECILDILDASGKVIPLDTIQAMLGTILYSGHIHNDADQRVTDAYLGVIFATGMLQGKNLLNELKSPDTYTFTYSKYTQFIEKNIHLESAKLYGLPLYLDTPYYMNKMVDTFSGLSQFSITNGITDANKEHPGESESLLSLLRSFLARLPPDMNMKVTIESSKSMLEDTKAPFVYFALDEFQRLCLLQKEVRQSLSAAIKGLSGTGPLNASLEIMLQEVKVHKVPTSWSTLSWPSEKSISAWLSDLVQRAAYLGKWRKQLSNYLPISMWLAGLFNPRKFLLVIQQVESVKKGLPISDIYLNGYMTTHTSIDSISDRPEDGYLIHGLYLSGAKWDRTAETGCTTLYGMECGGQLSQRHDFQYETPPFLPLLFLVPIEKSSYEKEDMQYQCPIYQTSARATTYVTTIPLNQPNQSVLQWILAGVAIVLQEDT